MSNAVGINKLKYRKKSKDIHVLYGFSDFEHFMEWASDKVLTRRFNIERKLFILQMVKDGEANPTRHKDWFGNPNYKKLLSNQLRDYQDLPKLNKVLNKFTQSIDSSLFFFL